MTLEDYSNPSAVYRLARTIYGDDVELKPSSRTDKKYMILNPNTDKWIHFGQMGYQDYTKHRSEFRRRNFRTRNKRWASQDKYTPGYMSYHLLW
jgi:hypothetical protein